MVINQRAFPAVALGCYLLAVSAYAQDANPQAPAAPPANLAYVEGAVDLVHEGLRERADPPMLLTDGDIVRTSAGRAEIVFADGSLLYLDHDTEAEFLEPERVRLQQGRALLRLSAASRSYFVDTPGGTITLATRGDYGITTDRTRGLEVTVARGEAEIDDGTQRVIVRGGEMVSLASVGARAYFQRFNSARWDAFEQWVDGRVNGFAASRSAPQLPYELRPYGPMLDQYGYWNYVAPYGYAWFPTVAAGWRPYYKGWWGHTRYGWTWYGRDHWAWPTHHFGRWGFNGSLWYWMPHKAWGPAWVTWGYAPGYVSWSPIGFDGVAVIGLWPHRDHPAYAPYYNPWRAWTVVPRSHFGYRRAIAPGAIDGNRLDEATRRAMVVQNTPPRALASAVPRASVFGPGGAITTGRDTSVADRPGNVRRPPAANAIPPRTETPATSASPRRVIDAPATEPGQSYVPPDVAGVVVHRGTPPTATADEPRRGGVRDPRAVYRTQPAPDDRPVVRAPAGTGGEPREAEGSIPQGGAVERGGRGGGGRGVPAGIPSRGGSDRGGSDSGGRIAPAPRGGSEGGGAQPRGGSPGVRSPGGRSPSGGAGSGGGGGGGAVGRGSGGSGGSIGSGGGGGGARPGAGGGGVRRP